MRRSLAALVVALVAATGLTAIAGPAGAGAPGDGYTVDGLIKIRGVTGFVGDGLFDTPDAVGQTLSTAASPAQKAVFVVRAQNEKFNRSNRVETWIEYADCDGPGEIQAFYQGENVSEQMFVDELEVGGVPAGGSIDVKIKIKVGPGAECIAVIGVASDKFPGGPDYVVAEAVSTQGVPL